MFLRNFIKGRRSKKTMRTRLKLFRVKHKLTQEQIADKIGYGRMTYANVENGKRNPSKNFCEALGKAFGLSLSKVSELMIIDED